MKARKVIIGRAGSAAIAVAALLVATASAHPTVQEDFVEGYRSVPVRSINAVRSRADKYPIVIPTTVELRKMLKARKRPPEKAVQKRENSGLPKDIPTGNLSQLRSIGRPSCDRALPTRSEFLGMLERRPADARQIMERCKLDVSTLSPLRQLPVGVRQLPQDTRQRPVGTWGR